jgi:hypothetical protein
MNTKSRLKGLIAVAALLAVPAAAEIFVEGGASAVEVSADSTSTPGSVVTAGPMISVRNSPSVGFKTAGVTVGASPSKDVAQNVKVDYILEVRGTSGVWAGSSWVQGAWKPVSGSLTATYGQWGAPFWLTTTKNDYRIVYNITWEDAATGATVARATVSPSASADTACALDVGCTKFDDHIRM